MIVRLNVFVAFGEPEPEAPAPVAVIERVLVPVVAKLLADPPPQAFRPANADNITNSMSITCVPLYFRSRLRLKAINRLASPPGTKKMDAAAICESL